jgi:hypothetical protein
LILGKNITLYGDGPDTLVEASGSGPWRTLNVTTFIRINENATVIMEDNAKITNFYSNTFQGIVRLASASARFYMQGGEITGNKTLTSGTFLIGVIAISGSKTLYDAGNYGVIEKSGGSVYENYSGTPAANCVTDNGYSVVKSLE